MREQERNSCPKFWQIGNMLPGAEVTTVATGSSSNVECRMSNVECRSENSTFDIRHSTFDIGLKTCCLRLKQLRSNSSALFLPILFLLAGSLGVARAQS